MLRVRYQDDLLHIHVEAAIPRMTFRIEHICGHKAIFPEFT
jgi:hypothetical protein